MTLYESLIQGIEERVAVLHNGPHMVWINETGVCGHLLFDLWRMPGSSATILHFGLPYHRRVQMNLLGHDGDESFASLEQAIYLAAHAYEEAFKVVSQEGVASRPVIGVGITGAVTTGRDRRGDDRAHVVIKDRHGIHQVSFTLPKMEGSVLDDPSATRRHREEQGILVDLVALNMILWATGVDQIQVPGSLQSSQTETQMEGWVLKPYPVSIGHTDLFNKVFWPNDSTTTLSDLDPKEVVLFPGSFNPLSFAHVEMARMIEGMTGKRVIFQISQQHPDKAVAPLPEEELRRRLVAFAWRHPVLFLPASGLYVEKARLLPGVQVLVGADAARSILNPRYYGGDEGRRRMLEELADLGSSFIVMGRVDEVSGRFIMRDDLDMPPRYAHLFEGVSARWDISSTTIRAQQAR